MTIHSAHPWYWDVALIISVLLYFCGVFLWGFKMIDGWVQRNFGPGSNPHGLIGPLLFAFLFWWVYALWLLAKKLGSASTQTCN